MRKIIFPLILILLCLGCSNSKKSGIKSISGSESFIVDTISGNKTIEKEKMHIFKKGDIVQLFKEEEWNAKQQKFVKTTKTSIFSNSRSLTEENLIATYPNGTQAEIIDIYEETLANGSIWRVYKVKTKTSPSKEGWIADFNLIK